MADIKCRNCGEPWDNDEFHFIAEEYDSTYQEVFDDFVKRGCAAMRANCSSNETSAFRGDAMDALVDLFGDDTDGIISMMDDAECMGYFSEG